MRGFLLAVVAFSLLACSESKPRKSSNDDDDEDRPRKSKSEKVKASASAQTSSAPPPAAAAAFVRERPQEPAGVDACAFTGGVGMACLAALRAEQDPIKRRYMRRLTDAEARQSLDEMAKGEPRGVAHPEVAAMCAETGPCGAKDANGNAMDDGYSCLTKAQSLAFDKDPSAAAVHTRACQCDAVGGQIPVMGGYLACDGPDKPVTRGQSLSSDEAKQIRDCAECSKETGAVACSLEIARLSASDPELANYLKTVHVPRCSQP